MTDIINGFIIATFVVEAFIFIRLGFILDELRKINKREKDRGRTCSTCIHSDLSAYDEPCYSCICMGRPGLPNWEAEDVNSD